MSVINWKTSAAFLLVGIIIGTAFGYGLKSYITPEEEGPPVNEVRIGYLVGLTGAISSFGPDMQAVAEIVVDEVNAAGGIQSLGGAKVRLIVADTESNAEVAKIQARRLITEENCHLLMGCFWSSLSFTASEEAEKLGIPFLCDTSSNPQLTERGYRTFFRVWAHDGIFAKDQIEFLKWMQEDKGETIEKIALIRDDTAFGEGVAAQWKKYNQDPEIGGYDIVADIAFTPGVSDVSSEVLALKESGAEVIFYASSPAGDAIQWVSTLKQFEVDIKAFIASAGVMLPEYVNIMGKDGWYVCARDFFSVDLLESYPKVKEFNDKFKAKTGKDLYLHPFSVQPTTYAAIKAIEKAGSVDPNEIIDSLRALEISEEEMIAPWEGIRFDENGQNIYAMSFQVQLMDDGEYHIVYPDRLASRDVIFPMPRWSDR